MKVKWKPNEPCASLGLAKRKRKKKVGVGKRCKSPKTSLGNGIHRNLFFIEKEITCISFVRVWWRVR
jgi:hypothetical protein